MASRATQIQFERIWKGAPMEKEFEEGMREVLALRVARMESHWKLFRLLMCMKEIKNIKA